MPKYAISIEQTHGYMKDTPEILLYKRDISEIQCWDGCFSQIGNHPECIHCKCFAVYPTGLQIVPYISEHDDEKAEEVLAKLNAFVRDDLDRIEIELTLDELPEGNKQTIRIWKM